MAVILHEEGDYTTVDDVYNRCMALSLLFFDNPDAFAVIDVIHNVNETHLHIMLAGGSFAGLFKLEKTVANFGREINASKFTFIGRRGLARVLRSQGWKMPSVYMEKEITYG